MSQPRVVLYTVMVGGYDSLPQLEPEPAVTYCLFTDHAGISAPAFWNRSLLENPSGLDPRRLSRLPKLRPHVFLPPHDVSVYIDACLDLRPGIADLAIRSVQEQPIAAHRHPGRKCIYAEAEKCAGARLDDPAVIRAQVERYRGEGFPENFGLTENRFLVRRNGEESVRFNETWHAEYFAGSQRDQLCFMYSIWKTGVPLAIIPQHARHNPCYSIRPHLLPRNGPGSPETRRLRND